MGVLATSIRLAKQTGDVYFGSIATEPSRAKIRQCPLFPESRLLISGS